MDPLDELFHEMDRIEVLALIRRGEIREGAPDASGRSPGPEPEAIPSLVRDLLSEGLIRAAADHDGALRLTPAGEAILREARTGPRTPGRHREH